MQYFYFDWAATSIPETSIIRNAEETYLNNFGNPSSIHDFGLNARKILEESRKKFAMNLGVYENEIIFTSGGTESNNIALFNLIRKLEPKSVIRNQPNILLSSIEHPSIYEPAKSMERLGFSVKTIKTSNDGKVSIEDIKKKLNERTVFVSVMYVNNETGVIQPIEEISNIVKEYSRKISRNIHFHTDAVQALGKIPFSLKKSEIDSASFSAHKIGGPKGFGALYIRSGKNVSSIFAGGGQERGKRSGTENVASSIAFAHCLEKYLNNFESNYRNAAELSHFLIKEIVKTSIGHVVPEERFKKIYSNHSMDYSPYIVSVSFPPIPSEVIVRALSEKGIMISAGSACSSGNPNKRDRVLKSIGVSERITKSTVRFSFGPSNNLEELKTALPIILETINQLKRIASK